MTVGKDQNRRKRPTVALFFLSHPSQTYGFVNIGLFKTVGLKTVGLKTVGFVNLIFQRPQIFFHNFVSFHPILMFHTILESGDQTNMIEDEFKTIRSIQINT